ncbi:MAG: ABC transporter substrate-binding protein [Ruminiclostridium sp.]
MKGRLKKAIAFLICIAAIQAFSACGNSTPSVTPASEETSITEVSENIRFAEIPENTDISGTTLKYFGSGDIAEEYSLKPAYSFFSQKYNAAIETEIAAEAEIMDKLSVYISSDKSPDLVDARDNTFPYYIAKNMYEPLDQYMDMTAPQWDGLSAFIENYSVGGKHYYYPCNYYVSPVLLAYDRGKFEELGIDDPYTLYHGDSWTWNSFYSCMSEFAEKCGVDNPFGVCGALNSSAICSTGKPLVGCKKGQLVNNIGSSEIEKAQNFLQKLQSEGLWNQGGNRLIDGNTAFEAVENRCLVDFLSASNNDENADIFFVPFPRNSTNRNYYYQLDDFGYMVPSGSKNIQAACMFINCVRLTQTDDDLSEATKQSIMSQKNITDEQYQFWDSLHHPENYANLVVDYSMGFDESTVNEIILPMLETAPLDEAAENQTFAEIREAYSPLLQEAVESMNLYFE